MRIKGKAFKYGSNIDTDVIIPARYLNSSEGEELAKHCMENVDPDFQSKFKNGGILVAQGNFGCGSSREHAPLALKKCGVLCIIAEDFARIFYRNAINIGLPILECPKMSAECEEGDRLEVDLDGGIIYNLTKNRQYRAAPFPGFLQNIIRLGGLLETARQRGE
jgi:3-isopropylmalate/(R)-2-methylmalate dehydratase small subunit